MKTYAILGALLLLQSGNASAEGGGCQYGNCPDGARTVCFNVVCNYEKEGTGRGFNRCQAAARFLKNVTASGGEIKDRSETPFNPEFEVQCDGRVLFNNAAHRYTDALGTRLQAETGPFPAVLLPQNSLRDFHSYVISALELRDQALRGFCYVYTGPQ